MNDGINSGVLTQECPYCGSRKSSLIAKNLPWPEVTSYFSVDYSMYECGVCDLVYASPLDARTLAGIESYLVHSYNTHRVDNLKAAVKLIWGGDFKTNVRRKLRPYKHKLFSTRGGKNSESLQLLREYGCKTVLDVGCSFGEFVALAFDSGFDAFGVEPNKKVVDAVENIQPGRVFQGRFPEQFGPLQHYSCIIFQGVVYGIPPHLLRDLFSSAFRRLEPNGVLIVFDHDSFNRFKPESRNTLQGALTLTLVGKKFMHQIANDMCFHIYQHVRSKSEPNCCFHVFRK
jgi:SAM-dependent methyltransferase